MELLIRKVRMALTPRARLLRTVLSDGVILEGRNESGWGGRGVFVSRDDIEPEFARLSDLVDRGSVVVDIGANTGIYTLRAAKLVGPEGTVLSFEPFPEMASQLHRNVLLNRLGNVRIRCFCVAGSTGLATFWTNFSKPNSYSLVRHDPDAAGLSVLKFRLDDVWQWEQLGRLDYLKMDAEGVEQEILSGAAQLISRFRPLVLAEILFADLDFPHNDYVSFRAKHANGAESSNIVFVPTESPKLSIVKGLGWRQL